MFGPRSTLFSIGGRAGIMFCQYTGTAIGGARTKARARPVAVVPPPSVDGAGERRQRYVAVVPSCQG